MAFILRLPRYYLDDLSWVVLGRLGLSKDEKRLPWEGHYHWRAEREKKKERKKEQKAVTVTEGIRETKKKNITVNSLSFTWYFCFIV